MVWCAKYRRRVLGGRVAVRLRELIERKATEMGWEIIAVEVMPDQVHLVVKHEPEASASYVANQVKGYTSRAAGGVRRTCAPGCPRCGRRRCSWHRSAR